MHTGEKGRVGQIERGTDINIPCCCLVAKSCLILCHPIDCTHQAPLSMGFPRQEHWSGLPFPSPGGLLDPGIESASPPLQGDSLPQSHQGSTYATMGKIDS